MTSWSGKKLALRAALLAKQLYRSVWFFPVILAVPLLIFTALEIHGSSVGTYHKILYGPGQDNNVILNEPRSIRSDEWLVNTQKTISQAENGFPLVNDNMGKGENMSVIVDVPYKEWSVIFKPHNTPFFFLPLEKAFSMRWWLMGYLLVVSCYFFVLALAPKKRLLAATLATALFFSAFIQWWYLYGTLGSLYYPLFIATIILLLTRQRERWKKYALGGLLAYLIACFALVLYPPFQIATGLVLFVFLLGYFIEQRGSWSKQALLRNLGVIAAAGIIAGVIVGAFLLTRMDVVKTANDTAYPGKRTMQSGGFYPVHFMSPHLGRQFNSETRTAQYLIDGKTASNQSETSNFLLLLPFLFLPSVFLIYYEYRRKKKIDWPLLLLNGLFIVFLLEMFMPAFTPASKLLLLDKVGSSRVLIGLGLMNIMVFALLVRNLARQKFSFPRPWVIGYCLLVFAVELGLGLYARDAFDKFLSLRGAIAFALPLPLVIYLLLRKRFLLSALIYLAFSVFISFAVNPLYKGLSTMTDDPLSKAVETIGKTSDKRWISDGGYLENVASINGEPSVSGIYDYPQLDLWKDIPNTKEDIYNRYAHVGFQLDDNPRAPTTISLITPDSFVVKASSCSGYLRRLGIGFVVTSNVLKGPCTELEKTVNFPNVTLYIYELK